MIGMNVDKCIRVLYRNEDEQTLWLCSYIYHNKKGEDYWHNFLNRHISLADLAFRLRDGVEYSTWTDALATVSIYVQDKAVQAWTPEKEALDMFDWKYNSKPIHWIIAALIAKQLKENE